MEEKYVEENKSEEDWKLQVVLDAFQNPKDVAEENLRCVVGWALDLASKATDMLKTMVSQSERDLVSKYLTKADGYSRIGELRSVLMCVRGICGIYGLDELLLAEYVRDWTPPVRERKLTRHAREFKPVLGRKCYCCGERGHMKRHCPAREARCGTCGKVGHTSKTCWKKDNRKCFCCGTAGHIKQHCPHKEDRCSRCSMVGHTEATCRRKGRESTASQLPKQRILPVMYVLPPEDEKLKTSCTNTVEDVVTTIVQTVMGSILNIPMEDVLHKSTELVYTVKTAIAEWKNTVIDVR